MKAKLLSCTCCNEVPIVIKISPKHVPDLASNIKVSIALSLNLDIDQIFIKKLFGVRSELGTDELKSNCNSVSISCVGTPKIPVTFNVDIVEKTSLLENDNSVCVNKNKHLAEERIV